MKNILVTGIGGPTPRSIARTLKKSFPNYRIIGVDANPKSLSFYIPDFLDAVKLVPRVDNDNYWEHIKGVIDEEKIDMAFVQPEMEVVAWGKYFDEHATYPCPVIIPPTELAISLMDKAIMADLLRGTEFIPSTVRVSQSNPRFEEIKKEIGFPFWIRATKGSGGLGSLKINDIENYKSWLFINREIDEFTVSEFLPGRHLATQMLYFNGEYIKGASLECVNYVMADIVPSKVTGNTSFGRFINEDKILDFCRNCMDFICQKLNMEAHGVLSFDLKEDKEGKMKVTEVNIRHMAYTGVMADVGFDLVSDTVTLIIDGKDHVQKAAYFQYDKPYIFLRDVDALPVVLEGENQFLSL
ncbi:MAG: hypothetical protein ACLFNU_09240 [Bacteroidales bacterium]